eukprot:CAMPEP_0181318730 /NCGR_PEP_ID=MMETSP1101-20121128/17167_1 /TAXON_ID=46948 /ORGANISM="Rhodomonas abbreviata, Strain Caron Lab Isolate" /LENGTH=79 /DNA_ID=CAMNT_0023426229 /DNA_START=52 /DNA_END=291 /DNA_ORIENTATION=+
MPIALLIIPMALLGGVVGAIGFASQETEDMSPAEQTKKLNREAAERLDREEALRKKIMSTDTSGFEYREKLAALEDEEK